MNSSKPRFAPTRYDFSVISLSLLILAGVGLVSRLIVARFSYGSNDIITWQEFAIWLDQLSLTDLYTNVQGFNHPPLMGYLAHGAWQLSALLGVPFALVFKTPMIVADVLTALLLWVIWRRRAGTGEASMAVMAYSWSLVAILISGFHGNTDSLAAFLCLLAAFGVATGRPLTAGLALAAAINVKLLPLLLLPAFVMYWTSRRNLARFIAGSAVGVLPFIPILMTNSGIFYRNAIAYNSNLDHWGVMLFLLPINHIAPWHDFIETMITDYSFMGRYLIMAGILWVGLQVRLTNKWNPYELGALSFALFLILTPGFGLQYLIYVCPLLFAVDWRWASVYSILAGAAAGLAYYSAWDGMLPVQAVFTEALPMSAAVFGLLAWVLLFGFVVRCLRER